MPSSSFVLKVGTLLAALTSTAFAAEYELDDSYTGSSFLDGFDFFTQPDPTNGFVTYRGRTAAANSNLIRTIGSDTYLGVDFTTPLTVSGPGRGSVRIETKKRYQNGLFIVDLKHMPSSTCGTWPAFWSLGAGDAANWPRTGEIDIIEGVNLNTNNKFVLHTDTDCKTDGVGQTGTQILYDCALDSPSGPSGCDVNAVESTSYGNGFNSANGGVFAMEWTDDFIKMWYFPRNSIPASITADKPDTADFGIPSANFQGDCEIRERFIDHKFIFDTTFCGDWAGNVYASSGCPQYPGLSGMDSCKRFVAQNPSAFSQSYWLISYFKTYTKKLVTSSSSSSSSSSTSSSSSSSTSSSVSTTSTSSSASTTSTSSSVSSTQSSSSVSSTESSSSASSTETSSSASSTQSSSSASSTESSSSASSTESSSSVSSTETSSSASSTETSSSSSSTESTSSTSSSATSSDVSSTETSSASSTTSDVSSSATTTADSSSSTSTESSTSSDASSSSSSTDVSSSATTTSDASSSTSDAASSTESSSSAATSSNTDSTMIYPTGSESDSGVYPTGTSSSEAYPDTTTTCTTSSAGYGYDSSSVAYPTESSSVPVYGESSSVPVYSESSSVPVYGESSSIPVYGESSSVPVYGESSSAPVYGESAYPSTSEVAYPTTTPAVPTETKEYPHVTKTYTTTYVDVCPTGYTTISTTHTVVYDEPTGVPTPKEYPPGFTTTVKYCDKGCGENPTYVTVTVPVTETIYETASVPAKPTSEAEYVIYSSAKEAYPSSPVYPEVPKPEEKPEEYKPGQPEKEYTPSPEQSYPATPEESSKPGHEQEYTPSYPAASTPAVPKPEQTVYATQIVTLSVVPVPAAEYHASKSAESAAVPEHASAPAVPEHYPVKPEDTPAYYHPAPNVTVSFGTGAPSVSKTGYVPEFTGAAASVKVGGVLGAVVAMVGLLVL